MTAPARDAAAGAAYPLLFSPFQLGALSLPNRVVMAPMSSSLADDMGFVTPELVAFVRERALGGTGLVIVEFTCVDASYGVGEKCQPRIDRDEHIAGHARMVRAITSAGARACLQLHLPGQYVVGSGDDGALPVAPSNVFARDGRQIARALDTDQVARLVRRFAQAARRAVLAGYQAIEIHGAHGYLPMAFLSPRKNRRDDAWGGDFERRMAFPLAIARALREELGAERPLIYRLSAAEFVEAGLTLDDMERIAPRLAQAGCDALHVSSGAVEGALDKIVDPMSAGEGWRFPLGRRLRAAAGIPVIAVGPVRWPATAERALAEGDADLIALGRPLLADPHWANKARAGDLAGITPCTNCNWCMERVRGHLAIGCAETPGTGHEAESDARLTAPCGSVAVVVGAGPGGLQAAYELDRLGYATHLFEARSDVGGGLVTSAAPPFKQPLRWYQDHLRHRLALSATTVHLGHMAQAGELLALRPSVAIIATGSRVREWPLPGGAAGSLPVLDATDLLTGVIELGSASPVVVYGGGETGCETAEYLAVRGAQVILVTRSGLKEMARAAEPMYRKQLRARLGTNPRVRILSHATITRIDADGVLLELADDEPRMVPAAALVMAQGREPASDLAPLLRAAGVACAAIGDADAIGRIGDAVHAAHRAVRRLVAENQSSTSHAESI